MTTETTTSTTETSNLNKEETTEKRFPPSVFPVKLHRLLNETSSDKDRENIISWTADGRSFRVHDKARFASEIMPEYFGSLKYRSFQKNLNMWGFCAVRRGECSHELFVRDSEPLLHKMKRQPVMKKVPQAIVDSRQRKISHTLAACNEAIKIAEEDEDTDSMPSSNRLPYSLLSPGMSSFTLRGTPSMGSIAGLTSGVTGHCLPDMTTTTRTAAALSTGSDLLDLHSALLRRQAATSVSVPSPATAAAAGLSKDSSAEQTDKTAMLRSLLIEEEKHRQAIALHQEQRMSRLRAMTNIAILGELQHLSDALQQSRTVAQNK